MSDAPAVGRDSRADSGPLGKYTKSATPPDLRAKLQADRATRYELLASARALFLHQGKHEGLKHPHDWHRTAKCKWVNVSGFIGVHASREHSSAFYTGLMSCGSVWACPVCAAKVQERRREEVAQAVAWADAQGLQSAMVTLTFPHYAWNKLKDLIGQQADALHRLRAGAPWSRFKTATGYQGLIRSLELTIGGNGWHPHTHELWFVDAGVDADAMKTKILERWRSCCARAGLLDLDNADQVEAFNAHAVDVKGWCKASDYLAKQDDSRHWGVDNEIAKASTKQGKAKGKHPFGLLALAQDGDKQAGAKYAEYAQVMRGKRQLYWSAGLKGRVGLDEQTDEELAEEQRDQADLLGYLDCDDWKLIRAAGLRAQVLNAAESNGGWVAVQHLVRTLRKPVAPTFAPSPSWNKDQRRRSAMQVVELSKDEKNLLWQAGKALYGQTFQDKTREIIGAAPAPRVDEEMVYLVAERDMPTHVWPTFRQMYASGYAEKPREKDPDQDGEVLLVDGSILDLLMEALKRVLETLLGVGDAGSPPAGPGRNARSARARQGSLLIEHDGRR